jgi:hypothetical protein
MALIVILFALLALFLIGLDWIIQSVKKGNGKQ